jgi:hypothetical protein
MAPPKCAPIKKKLDMLQRKYERLKKMKEELDIDADNLRNKLKASREAARKHVKTTIAKQKKISTPSPKKNVVRFKKVLSKATDKEVKVERRATPAKRKKRS